MTITPKQLRAEREAASLAMPDDEPNEERLDTAVGPRRFSGHYLEEIIQKAIQRGDFDDLPGKGKPLDLNDEPDPYDTSGNWMVNHIMKNANIAPEWIELDKQIRQDVAWLRSNPANHPERRSRIVELNEKILQFNVSRPPSIPTKPRYKE